MDMNEKLLAEVRARRDEARKKARTARFTAEEAEGEYHELDEAVHTLERITREHADFNKSAQNVLS